jgi:hypothetical protein
VPSVSSRMMSVAIRVGALIALGCNKPTYRQGDQDVDARPGYAG